MSKLVWDADGSRFFENGVDHGTLYVRDTATGEYPTGVAWNGLTSVSENPTGAEANPIWADNMKYLNLISKEEEEGSIEAYTYPDEFAECDGSAAVNAGVFIGQQPRKTFGMAYRTNLGNDLLGTEYGYKLHLVYGATASPSEKTYETEDDDPDAINFSWDYTTVPVTVEGHKPTATITVDSKKCSSAGLKKLEGVLFGADTFSASSTYAVGDVVEHTTGEGAQAVTKLYICKTAISTAAAWDDTKWDEVGNVGPRLPLPAEVITLTGSASSVG